MPQVSGDGSFWLGGGERRDGDNRLGWKYLDREITTKIVIGTERKKREEN